MSIIGDAWNSANSTPTRKRVTRIAIGLALVLLVPALWLAWWLGSPLFIDDVANEDFPRTVNAEIPAEVTRDEAEQMMETAAKLESNMSESMPAGEPVSLKSGSFRDEDRLHRGSGSATVYDLGDGSNLLRLEDLDVTNGPDLHVLLMIDPEGRDKSQGYIDLGKLKGNVGNQNYPIPDDINPVEYSAVMIYCEPFHVIFTTAPLK